MISADNQEIKVGDVVYNRWGEAERITGESHCKNSVYCNRVEGNNVTHVLANTLYKSQIAALERHVAWVAKTAFQLELEAKGFRMQEEKIRARINELEKAEALARQLAEIPDEMPQDD